jgi:hypothetical protein
MQRAVLSLVVGLVVLASACSDSTQIAAPVQNRLSQGKANHDSYGNNYICNLDGVFGNSSLYVGQSTSLSVIEPLCVGPNVVDYGTADVVGTGAVSGAGFHVSSAVITGRAEGTGTVNLSACCDAFHNPISVDVYITVTHAPLAVGAFGPTSPPTGTACSYDVSTSGGYPPYSYSWTTDGTLNSGSNSVPASITFGSDGNYEVSVTVTDSHGTQATNAIFVNAATVSPQPITCS